jgi:hypothetical protein
MALYRQIAGIPDSIGLSTFRDLTTAIQSLQNGGIVPVDYTTPIQTVQPSTPINVTDTGGTAPFTDPREWNPIDQYKPPLTTIDFGPSVLQPTVTPSQPETPTTSVLPADINTAIKNNILPLLALAGIVVVAVKGDDLLHEKRKIALLGGLGLLYYGMAKNKLV